MKILFIENDTEIINWVGGNLNNHNVTKAETFFAAQLILAEKPNYFDAVILDLKMPAEDLPENLQDEDDYPGYIFYKNILKDYDKLYKNTIFLTGYSVIFKDFIKNTEHKDLRIVRKNDKNPIGEILKYLREMQ